MDKHKEAKELYENSNISLAEIARRLDLNASTVKSWRRREGWTRAGEKPNKAYGSEYGQGQNPNTLATLKANQKIVQPGEKIALKHGLYSDHSNEEGYAEYYNEAVELETEETALKTYARAYANLMVALDNLDLSNPAYLEPMVRVSTMVANLAEKPGKIVNTKLNNKLKEYSIKNIERIINGDDPALDVIRSYTESFKAMADNSGELDEANQRIESLEHELDLMKSKLDEAGIDYE